MSGEDATDAIQYIMNRIQPVHCQSIIEKLSDIQQKNKQAYEDFFKGHAWPPHQTKQDPPMDYMELIFARLRIPVVANQKRSLPNIDHISIYAKGADVAIIFIVKGKTPVVIEDDPGLFPSDNLITQLRLLMAPGE